MTPVEAKLLGRHIAREIFMVGSEGQQRTVQRIQFMHGRYPSEEERPGGGLAEGPLADVIASSLLKHAREAR